MVDVHIQNKLKWRKEMLELFIGLMGAILGVIGGIFISKMNDYNLVAQNVRIKIIEFKYLLKKFVRDVTNKVERSQDSKLIIEDFWLLLKISF
jgi:hypothetical protein